MGRDLALSLGGRKKISLTKFVNDLFLGIFFDFMSKNF